MNNQLNNSFATFITIAFAFVISIISVQEATAQRYLVEMKDTAEVKELAKYAERLAEFFTVADAIAKINTSEGTAEPDQVLLNKFLSAKIKVTQDERIVGANAFKLIKLWEKISPDKNSDEELRKEIDKLLQSRNARPFFKSGVSVLGSAVGHTDAKRIEKDTNKIFAAPLKLGFYKPKFSCAVLATAIFAAELRNANKTAATVDSFFKAVCNATGSLDQ